MVKDKVDECGAVDPYSRKVRIPITCNLPKDHGGDVHQKVSMHIWESTPPWVDKDKRSVITWEEVVAELRSDRYRSYRARYEIIERILINRGISLGYATAANIRARLNRIIDVKAYDNLIDNRVASGDLVLLTRDGARKLGQFTSGTHPGATGLALREQHEQHVAEHEAKKDEQVYAQLLHQAQCIVLERYEGEVAAEHARLLAEVV